MAKKATRAIPKGYHTVTPSLCIDGADRAMEWYQKALGAERISRFPSPDGKLMHGEISIGDSRVYVADPMMDAKDPKALGGSPVSLFVYVENCDALYDQAVRAGATASMPVADQFWGDRMGMFTDPFGYRWMIATRKEDLTPEEMATRGEEFFKRMGKP